MRMYQFRSGFAVLLALPKRLRYMEKLKSLPPPEPDDPGVVVFRIGSRAFRVKVEAEVEEVTPDHPVIPFPKPDPAKP